MDTEAVLLDEINTALAFLQEGNTKDAVMTLTSARDYIMNLSPAHPDPDSYDYVIRELGVAWPSDEEPQDLDDDIDLRVVQGSWG